MTNSCHLLLQTIWSLGIMFTVLVISGLWAFAAAKISYLFLKQFTWPFLQAAYQQSSVSRFNQVQMIEVNNKTNPYTTSQKTQFCNCSNYNNLFFYRLVSRKVISILMLDQYWLQWIPSHFTRSTILNMCNYTKIVHLVTYHHIYSPSPMQHIR